MPGRLPRSEKNAMNEPSCADAGQPFEDQHREPGAREVGGGREAVVPGADHHDVVGAALRSHRPNLGHAGPRNDNKAPARSRGPAV